MKPTERPSKLSIYKLIKLIGKERLIKLLGCLSIPGFESIE